MIFNKLVVFIFFFIKLKKKKKKKKKHFCKAIRSTFREDPHNNLMRKIIHIEVCKIL